MTALAQRTDTAALVVAPTPGDFTREQVDLIKDTVAAGTSDLELKLFLEVCKSTGLNPFLKQVYAIKRKSGRDEKMTIQTGIDGYRLIASRTGAHLGTTDTEFGPDVDGYPSWARVVVKRLVMGHVAEFPATAYWAEYVQSKDEWVNNQRTGRKTVTDMWARMPHTMLAKCAESLALRKAFPAELSGIYTAEEMAQAENDTQERQRRSAPVKAESISPEQRQLVSEAWKKAQAMGLHNQLSRLGDTYTGWRTDHEKAQLLLMCIQAIIIEAEGVTEADATPLITEPQRKALMGHMNRLGYGAEADSEKRARFYAWMNPAVEQPTRTKELSEEQAEFLIDTLSGMDADAMRQARREFEGGGN